MQEVDDLPKTSCGFTGHRPAKLPWKDNEMDRRCVQLKDMLRSEIVRLANAGIVNFLSGMALGTDVWAAEIVLDERKVHPKLKLHCILPCKEQADKWATKDQLRYFNILEKADSVVYTSREQTKSCMLERNRFLVEHSDFILAVYDGKYRSGTAATVRYAQRLRRDIAILDPNTLELLRHPAEREEHDE